MSPPFQYSAYTNPYAVSIGDLLLRHGDIAAHAAEIKGQAQGQALSNIGQTIAAVPGQIRQANAQAQESELRGLQLGEAKRTVQARSVLGQIVSSTPHADEDGVSIYDIPAISTKLEQAGFGDHVADVATQLKGVNDAFRTERQAKLATVQRGAQALLQTGPDAAPELTLNFIDALAKNHSWPGGQLDQFRQIIQKDPTKTAAILRQFAGPEKIGAAAPDSTLYGETSGTPVGKVAGKGPQNEAELALDAANPQSPTRAQSQTALDLLRSQKNPASLEEQYLSAVTKGDTAGAGRILQSLKDTAAAKRDPAMQAVSEQLKNLSVQEAQQRLDALKEKNKPGDVSQSTFTTMSGRQYVDLGEFQTPEAREKARQAAITAGVVPVNKDVADGLRAADTARANFKAMWAQLEPYLPKDAAGRLLVGPKNKLEKIFQTNPTLGAIGSWRTAAIQAVQALAEKGMGLRLNRSEIDLMLQNDIPQITDDGATAKQRIDNMMTLLDHKEQDALVRDRSSLGAATPTDGATRTVDGVPLTWKTVNGKAGWYK